MRKAASGMALLFHFLNRLPFDKLWVADKNFFQ
jgi:hypothetical protein